MKNTKVQDLELAKELSKGLKPHHPKDKPRLKVTQPKPVSATGKEQLAVITKGKETLARMQQAANDKEKAMDDIARAAADAAREDIHRRADELWDAAHKPKRELTKAQKAERRALDKKLKDVRDAKDRAFRRKELGL